MYTSYIYTTYLTLRPLISRIWSPALRPALAASPSWSIVWMNTGELPLNVNPNPFLLLSICMSLHRTCWWWPMYVAVVILHALSLCWGLEHCQGGGLSVFCTLLMDSLQKVGSSSCAGLDCIRRVCPLKQPRQIVADAQVVKIIYV